MTRLVLDASAAVELIARSQLGHQLAARIPAGSSLVVPDGLFDVEVHAVLRRWDLNEVLGGRGVQACLLRLASLRPQRARVVSLSARAWQLRANLTFADACYVALAEALGCSLLTADLRLAAAPNLPIAVLLP